MLFYKQFVSTELADYHPLILTVEKQAYGIIHLLRVVRWVKNLTTLLEKPHFNESFGLSNSCNFKSKGDLEFFE